MGVGAAQRRGFASRLRAVRQLAVGVRAPELIVPLFAVETKENRSVVSSEMPRERTRITAGDGKAHLASRIP